MVVPAVVAWLSIETKPTFAALLPALPLLFIRHVGWRATVIRSVAVILIIAGVLLKDRLLGSAFVGVGQGQGSSYAIANNPLIVLQTLGFYLARLLPAWAYLVIALAYGKLIRQGRWEWAGVFAAMTLLAIVPVLAIPNHRFEMYSWYGASILLLPAALLWGRSQSDGVARVVWQTSSWVAASIALIAIASASPQLRGWYELNQRANANTLAALDTLRAKMLPGERLLLVGALNAFSPFRSDAFIELRFPYSFEWHVAVPPRDEAWIIGNRDSSRAIRTSEIDLARYDRVAVFSNEGRLLNLTRPQALASLPAPFRVPAFGCNYRDGMVIDSTLLGCLLEVGEHRTVLHLAANDPEKDQWEHFSVGQSHEALGDRAKAHDAYAAANRLEQAPIFADAMKRTIPAE